MPPTPNNMPDCKPSYVLKIFNGIHQGAELKIHSSCYTIGSSDDCDIILSDADIAANHLQIRLSEAGLSVEAREGAVYIEGKRIADDAVRLEPHKVVTISGVHMGIGVSGDDWQPSAFPHTGGAEEEKSSAKNSSRLPLTQFIAGIAGCLIVGVGFFLLSGNLSIENNAMEEIRNIFRQLKLEEPQIAVQENGTLKVVGYTKNQDQEKKVVEKLNKMALKMSYKIYVADMLLESCHQVISNMALPIKVAYRDHGVINLKGVVQTKEDLQTILLKLKQDVAGIRMIQNQVCVLSDIVPDLNNILLDYGLKDKITIELHPTYLIAAGTLDAYNIEIWNNAKTAILQKYGKDLVIRDNFHEMDYRTHIPGKISLPITGVSIGALSYITLEGGKKYFEGGSLENGNTIKSITMERIVLLINGREYYCDL